MDSKQLKVFVIVADNKSFSKAEEHLFLSKFGMKKQIEQLEEEVGVNLFCETKHGIFLTPAGEAFYKYAQEALKKEEEIIEHVQEIASQKESITLLNPPHPRLALERAISEFGQCYPNILQNIQYTKNSYMRNQMIRKNESLEQILDGSADIAEYILYENEILPDEIGFTKLMDQVFYCLMSENHPLAKETTITFEQLSGQLIGTFRGRIPLIIDQLQQKSDSSNFLEPSFGNIPRIFSTCHNNGIWITKAYYAKFLPPLVAVPLEYECKTICGIIYRKDHSANTEKFINIVKELYT